MVSDSMSAGDVFDAARAMAKSEGFDLETGETVEIPLGPGSQIMYDNEYGAVGWYKYEDELIETLDDNEWLCQHCHQRFFDEHDQCPHCNVRLK